jgi:hypothetical protein
MNAQTIKIVVVIIVFVLGLLFTTKTKSKEGFGTTSSCPNLLIKKDGAYYLQDTSKPASAPIKFNTLDDYTKFVEWQRSNGIRCPILYLQQTADAQGSTSYRMMPDPRNPEGGLSVAQFPTMEGELRRKLTDASRLSNIFNRGLYPGYDPTNQDIGVSTPLDQIYTSYGPVSDNPMDPNWGGVKYSENVVDMTGKYAENAVKIWVA